MRFYHIFHKNSIWSLIEDLTGLFSPPPPRFRKEMDNMYVHFRRVFVEFVVLLTKIWPTNIDFLAIQLNVGERAVQRAGLAPPPLSHQEVIDAI